MYKNCTHLGEIKEYVDIYRNNTSGIAFVANGSTGTLHSCHSNIMANGSISGMKKRGYWGKKDRCIRSNGFIYNIDTFIISDELDKIAADNCMCEACMERRGK